MKISRDDGSWHASGVLARDARHVKTEQQVAGHRAKKDTKRWCRGRVGKEHDLEWVNFWAHRQNREYQPGDGNWWMSICKRCEKHIESCRSWMGGRCNNPKHPHYAP